MAASGAAALRAIAAGSDARARDSVGLGGMAVLVSTLRTLEGDTDTAREGCAALNALAAGSDARAQVCVF